MTRQSGRREAVVRALALAGGLVFAVAGARPTAAAPGIDSSIHTIYLVTLSHLDIGFTDPPDVVADQQKAYIDEAIDLVDANPDYVWTVEELWQLEQWILRSTPAEIAHLADLARAGRIGLTAGYVTPHSDEMDAEEANRFFTYADSLRRAWNVPLDGAIQDDVPGFSWAYPSVFQGSGVQHLVCGVNTFIGGSPSISRGDYPFHWEGPEGARVLTWIAPYGYLEGVFAYGLYSLAVAYESLSVRLPEWTAAGYPYDAILVMGGTGDNSSPNTGLLNFARQWNAAYDNPKLVLATPRQFFQHLRSTYGDAHPVYRGGWGGIWDGGTNITPNTLAAVRRAHDASREAQTLASVAAVLGLDSFSATTDRYIRRHMLQVDEHCGGGVPWANMMTRVEAHKQNFIHVQFGQRADSASAGWREDGLAQLAAQVATPEPSVVVVNTLSWPRTGPVRVALPDWQTVALCDPVHDEYPVLHRRAATGEVVFVARDVPGIGYATFYRRNAVSVGTGQSASPAAPGTRRAEPPHAATSHEGPAGTTDPAIENEFYRVTVNPADGMIASILDKTTGRELVNGAAPYPWNGVIRATNRETLGGIWHAVPLGPATIAVTDAPPEHSLTITRSPSPVPSATVTLYDGVPAVAVTDTLDRKSCRWVPYDVAFEFYDLTFPFALGAFTAHIDSRRPSIGTRKAHAARRS